ncbi:MAG: methyltransferase [Pseudomonadota bacterium]
MSGAPDEIADAYNRALADEKAGRISDAIDGYRFVLERDPSDQGGAILRLAGLGVDLGPQKAPDAYVATLFDQQAKTFDETLVEDLGYGVPLLMRSWLDRHHPGRFEALLDLGCGTGLVGISLADLAEFVVGVDLAEGMLAEAHQRQAYHELYEAEAVEFLEALEPEGFDIITAADVMPYIGNVEPFMSAAATALCSNGILLVSTEALLEDADRDYRVGATQRFQHRLGYIESVATKASLQPLASEEIVVRYEVGNPVPGHLIGFRKTG